METPIKIAFLVLNQRDNIRRCEAFIRNYLDAEYSIVFLKEEWEKHLNKELELSYKIPIGNVRYLQVEEFKSEEYQLVLPNTDKVMDFLLSVRYPGMINANDKCIFQRKVDEFGKFDRIRSNVSGDSFVDGDSVMMKPRISSGGYSSNPLCYNKRRFDEVKEFAEDSEYLIQEYIESYDILLLSFASNGKVLSLYDIVEQEFQPSRAGNIFTSYIQSNLALREKPEVAELIAKTREFFEFIEYQNFVGFFGIQFISKDGKFIPIDCNLRTGPVAMELEFRKIADTRMYKAIPFFFGDKQCQEYLENPATYERYRCYAEANGKPITTKKFNPNFDGRVCISTAKTSGTFRRDYEMYIERLIEE